MGSRRSAERRNSGFVRSCCLSHVEAESGRSVCGRELHNSGSVGKAYLGMDRRCDQHPNKPVQCDDMDPRRLPRLLKRFAADDKFPPGVGNQYDSDGWACLSAYAVMNERNV